MALQNRVTPEGAFIAHPARGTLMGNRGGRLHRPDGTLGTRRWASHAWIACRLSFKDRHREVMAPRSYTELFFLDEATAYAAGHRPCAECRRADFTAFRDLWARVLGGSPRAPAIDAALHAARVGEGRRQAVWTTDAGTLPDGTFIRLADRPHLVLGDDALPWSPEGYGAPIPRPSGPVAVLTPEPIVRLFAAGLSAGLHPSARRGSAPDPGIFPEP